MQCKPRAGYVKPVTTYCSLAEYELAKPHFVQAAIERLLQNEPVLALRLALFSYSDLSMANRLCKVLSPATRELSISVQKDLNSEAAVQHLVACAAGQGVAGGKAFFGGLRVGGINSFHPKLIYMETPTRRIALIGSGNISNGRKHIDYVYAVALAKTDPANDAAQHALVEWTDCVTQRVNDAAFDSTREAVLHVRAACKPVDPKEASFIMPGDARPWLARAGFLLGQSDELRVVSQGFNSGDVAYLARLAIRAGKKVKILLDDDLFWSVLYPNGDLMNEPYELQEFVLPLIRLGAEVRYVITNHHDPSRNFQHAKAYSFHGPAGGAAMIGSLNATASALADNLEVLTEISGVDFQSYVAWFQDIWARAVAHETMPPADPMAKP